jgi:hypothetical protein
MSSNGWFDPRFDTVDLPVEFIGMGGEIVIGFHARLGDVFRHREGELGAFEIGCQRLDRLVVEIGLELFVLHRAPVAEEDIELFVLEHFIGDIEANQRLRGLIAECGQDHRRCGVGERDIRPAEIRHANSATGFGIRGIGRKRQQGYAERGESKLACVHIHSPFLMLSETIGQQYFLSK